MIFKLFLGTVTRHWRQYQEGKKTSTNPVASIFAWTRGLQHRAKLDNNQNLKDFSQLLEKICIESIDIDNVVTKDLAVSIQGGAQNLRDEHYVNTDEFLNHIKTKLEKELSN